jgi:hypothetical protein
MVGLLVVLRSFCDPIYVKLPTIYGIVKLVRLLESGVCGRLIGHWEVIDVNVGRPAKEPVQELHFSTHSFHAVRSWFVRAECDSS